MAQNLNNFPLKSGEALEDLQINNLKIIQNKNYYRFTSDSVLLSNFVKIGPKDNVLELCSGCGVISILINEKYKPKSVVGIDIDETLVDMANRSLEFNNLTKIKFICDDANSILNYAKRQSFDAIVCNPPYFILNQNEKVDIKKLNAKYEIKININQIFDVAEKSLKFGGKFFLCFTPTRIQELLSVATSYNFVLKKLQFVYSKNKQKLSTLALCYFVKNGKNFCEVVEPKLV